MVHILGVWKKVWNLSLFFACFIIVVKPAYEAWHTIFKCKHALIHNIKSNTFYILGELKDSSEHNVIFSHPPSNCLSLCVQRLRHWDPAVCQSSVVSRPYSVRSDRSVCYHITVQSYASGEWQEHSSGPVNQEFGLCKRRSRSKVPIPRV